MNYTYILKCSDGSLYCGWTNELLKRVKAHNEGKGAKYTRGRGPVELVYYEEFETKGEAMKREAEIKRMKKRDKQGLIKDQLEFLHAAGTGHLLESASLLLADKLSGDGKRV